MTNPEKNVEDSVFPSYALVLDNVSVKYLTTYLKMYQLYYSIDASQVFENTVYKNHFVRLKIYPAEETVYSWMEFMMYEVVDLVNNLHTITDGVYTTAIRVEDFLKSLNFELFWEQLEDWAEYLSLDDFKDGSTPNIEYVYKFFKCTEHWLEKNKTLPVMHKETLEKLKVDIDEYYATYIMKDSPGEEEPEENTEDDSEINVGGIPGTQTALPAAKRA